MDFQGGNLSSDTGFLPMREFDQRYGVIAPMADFLKDNRSAVHTKHALAQMIRQPVYQMAAGYEDCNDVDFLRVDPPLRLTMDKGHRYGTGQSALPRLENHVLGNAKGLMILNEAILRSANTLIIKRDKYHFIFDVDSTKDPAYGRQEDCVYNGHFGKTCFYPIVAFTGDVDCLATELRPGHVHSADGVLNFIEPLVERYRARCRLFWFRDDAAFAIPVIYDYCERKRITYFIRLPSNETLRKIMGRISPGARWAGHLNQASIHCTSSFPIVPGLGRNAAGWCARSNATPVSFSTGWASSSPTPPFLPGKW